MKVKYIGFGGYMEVPCYQDENGKIYFDENNGRNGAGRVRKSFCEKSKRKRIHVIKQIAT